MSQIAHKLRRRNEQGHRAEFVAVAADRLPELDERAVLRLSQRTHGHLERNDRCIVEVGCNVRDGRPQVCELCLRQVRCQNLLAGWMVDRDEELCLGEISVSGGFGGSAVGGVGDEDDRDRDAERQADRCESGARPGLVSTEVAQCDPSRDGCAPGQSRLPP